MIPRDGAHPWRVVAWGGAPRHRAEAWAAAQERLARAIRRVSEGVGGDPGAYDYDADLREEILQEMPAGGGDPPAIVTRNRYGAEVLATADVPIIDIDVVEDGAARPVRRGLLGWIWAAITSPERDLHEVPAAPTRSAALDRIRDIANRQPGLGLRVYATRAGFRVFVLSERVRPRESRATELFLALGADPLYVRLCRVQDCYRARLTPKPWRIGAPSFPAAFPNPAPWQVEAQMRWLDTYYAASASYSTCALVEEHGPPPRDPVVHSIISLHDVRAAGANPLA